MDDVDDEKVADLAPFGRESGLAANSPFRASNPIPVLSEGGGVKSFVAIRSSLRLIRGLDYSVGLTQGRKG